MPYRSTPLAETFIFHLPDELLVPIVDFVADREDGRWTKHWEAVYNTDVVLNLSRVCHRLRRIAQPILFSDLDINRRTELRALDQATIKLHRTLTERADLRQYCRSLQMILTDTPALEHTYPVAEDFAKWLTKTRYISIIGGFEKVNGTDEKVNVGNQRTWNLIHQIMATFQDLEEVHISRQYQNIFLPPFFMWPACPKLKVSNIHGLSECHNSVALGMEKRRTASFTSLALSGYEERPEATQLLIEWPATLVRFSLKSFLWNPHVMDYPMFEAWLLIHRSSLTHIELGSLSRKGSRRLFNAPLFPNLEYLKLSRRQMSDTLQFSPEDAIVLGPNLKTFAWGFEVYGEWREQWSDFGEPEENWLQDLVKYALLNRAALKKIEIEFSPEAPSESEEQEYTWDRMDRVRDQVLRPNGLDLEYNEPRLSRDRWLELFHNSRNEEDLKNEEAANELMMEELQVMAQAAGEQDNLESQV